VFEGGEISMYYDPMIAKLCTWAPDRAGAIGEMRRALDAFEVEGIGHNLPFLSAVMDHPRFVAGEMTTAFIAEEYPDGFQGVVPEPEAMRRLAAVVGHMKMLKEARAAQISGAMPNHRRRVEPDYVIFIGKERFPVHIVETAEGTDVTFGKDGRYEVRSDWRPGEPLFRGTVGGHEMIVKVAYVRGGARLRWRGADLKAVVRTPREAELAALMPEKLPPDTSKYLLCPMPGLVAKIMVDVGEEVQEGQALATVEAMKMENTLRAERQAVVKKVAAAPGASLKVDDVILEFE
jgi:propionyl-CoA carboxylase alpha chain